MGFMKSLEEVRLGSALGFAFGVEGFALLIGHVFWALGRFFPVPWRGALTVWKFRELTIEALGWLWWQFAV